VEVEGWGRAGWGEGMEGACFGGGCRGNHTRAAAEAAAPSLFKAEQPAHDVMHTPYLEVSGASSRQLCLSASRMVVVQAR